MPVIALLLAVFLVASTSIISILAKNELAANVSENTPMVTAEEGSSTSSDGSADSTDTSSRDEDGVDTNQEEFDPELRYETQFFVVDVPPSWKGRWNFKEKTSEREAWSQIESYYFTFILDGEPQFEIGFTLVGLGSILPRLGSVNGYSGHIFSDNLTIEDRHYIIDHLTLLNQEAELPDDL